MNSSETATAGRAGPRLAQSSHGQRTARAVPPRLVERDEQWSDLRALLAGAVAGRGGAALITGPVAAGKTELLHALCEHAAESGFHCLKATGSRSETSLPFGVIGQLFAADLPADIAERAARAIDEGLAEVDPGEFGIARVMHALCVVLLDLAHRDPVLVAIDDVQHADLASVYWLTYLIRRLGSARVLLLLTETAAQRPAHPALRTELLRHPHCSRLAVEPLSPRGVAALVGDRASLVDRHLTAQVHATSGGNPLLARALLEDHRGARTGELEVGAGFQQAVLSCLYRCDPEVLSVARGLAVLGESASRSALSRLTGVAAEAVAPAVEALAGARLLDGGRFRHPAARSAVLDDTPAQLRRELHLRAARLAHDEGAPATEVAPHLALAGHAEGRWAVAALDDAAEQALRNERVEVAVGYLELALRGCADPRDRAATAAKLARAEWRLNPASAARRLPALTTALRAGHLADRDAAALVDQLLWHGDVAAAADALERLRRSGTDQRVRAADLRATEVGLACSHPPLARGGHALLDSARRESRLVDPAAVPRLKSVTALATVLTAGPTERAVTDAEHVLQSTHPSDGSSWRPAVAMPALWALVYADRLDLARSWCDRLLEEARGKGTAVGRALFSCARAEIAVRRGELAAAHSHATEALELLPPTAWGTTVGYPLATLITAATRMGRHDEAAAHVEQPVPEVMFQSRAGLHYLHARGHHHLATDRHYAALADFLACGELMAGWGLDQPGLVPWRTSAAEAWLRRGGNRDEARRLLNEQLAKLGPGPSRTRGAALRLLAATSRLHGRPQLLAEAAQVLEERGDQYELARALADLSKAHQALRQHRRAWAVARRAWHVASACDAAELCEELLPSRGRAEADTCVDADRIAALTDAERRVAALAAAGYTNREIAGKLFITPSTIEQHLTRVYRKLGVKHRGELPAPLRSYLPEDD